MSLNFRMVVALIACSVAFALAGCGGGGDDPNAEPDQSTQPLNCHVTPEVCK